MISLWFSRLFAPWNYLLAAPVAALFFVWSAWQGPILWAIPWKGSVPYSVWTLAMVWAGIATVLVMTERFLQNRLKAGDGYGPGFLVWVLVICSTDAGHWPWAMVMGTLSLALFTLAWLHFQNNEHGLSLFGAGVAAGLGSLFYAPLLALPVFGVFALGFWHQKSLRRSAVFLMGMGLPWYYRAAQTMLAGKDPALVWSTNLNPAWLLPTTHGGILTWDWLFLLGLACAGQAFRWLQPAEFQPFLRTVFSQALFLLTVLFFFAWVFDSDPWVLLAVSAPVWSLWGGAYLQFRDTPWVNDLLVLVWLVLWVQKTTF
ncbi:MAG: hypothetical protein EBR22_01545 [Cytophagia bacterium]|nr:hypothetical protein [Cytophagia bacterium]